MRQLLQSSALHMVKELWQERQSASLPSHGSSTVFISLSACRIAELPSFRSSGAAALLLAVQAKLTLSQGALKGKEYVSVSTAVGAKAHDGAAQYSKTSTPFSIHRSGSAHSCMAAVGSTRITLTAGVQVQSIAHELRALAQQFSVPKVDSCQVQYPIQQRRSGLVTVLLVDNLTMHQIACDPNLVSCYTATGLCLVFDFKLSTSMLTHYTATTTKLEIVSRIYSKKRM